MKVYQSELEEILPPGTVVFDVEWLGEPGGSETITMHVESGADGMREFADFMAGSLREWYDGAKVEVAF